MDESWQVLRPVPTQTKERDMKEPYTNSLSKAPFACGVSKYVPHGGRVKTAARQNTSINPSNVWGPRQLGAFQLSPERKCSDESVYEGVASIGA